MSTHFNIPQQKIKFAASTLSYFCPEDSLLVVTFFCLRVKLSCSGSSELVRVKSVEVEMGPNNSITKVTLVNAATKKNHETKLILKLQRF